MSVYMHVGVYVNNICIVLIISRCVYKAGGLQVRAVNT